MFTTHIQISLKPGAIDGCILFLLDVIEKIKINKKINKKNMSIVEAFQRGKNHIDDNVVAMIPSIDTSELSRQFSEVKKSLSESLTKKRKLENKPSPLIETFTDNWSKKFNHFRKRGRNGFDYTASENAKTHLLVLRIYEKIITEKRRLQYLKHKTVDSDIAKLNQKLLQLGETAANLSIPCQILIPNYTNNYNNVVMSNDFKALTPNNHVCHRHRLSNKEYQQVLAQKCDVELYISDAEMKISKLRESIGNDDLDDFDKVQQRDFKYEYRHEIFTYAQYCLCNFCTRDIFHLNEMLQP